MKKPLVTIYIANYNYSNYLEEAVDSVFGQTYNNIEVIIIDDHSTDNSIEVIKNLSKKYNFKYIRNKTNYGLTVVNNQAIKLAKGDYIMRLDADDILLPKCIELLVKEISKDKQTALVYGNWINISEDGSFISKEKRLDISKVALLDSPAHGACTLLRLDSLRSVGGYDEQFKKQDGYYIWLKLIFKYKVKNIDEEVFKYRKHDLSLSYNICSLLEVRAKILENIAAEKIQPKTLAIVPIKSQSLEKSRNSIFQSSSEKIIDEIFNPLIESKYITRIFLITADNEIKNYVLQRFGNKITVVLRSLELEKPNAALKNSIKLIESYSNGFERFDNILFRGIQSPYVKKHIIESSINYKSIFNPKQVICVSSENFKFFRNRGNGMEMLFDPESKLRLEGDQIFRKIPGFLLISSAGWDSLLSFSKEESPGYVLADKLSSKLIE